MTPTGGIIIAAVMAFCLVVFLLNGVASIAMEALQQVEKMRPELDLLNAERDARHGRASS